jgi:hypothetical protein
MGRGEHYSYQPHKVFEFVITLYYYDVLTLYILWNVHVILWKILKSKSYTWLSDSIIQ